MRNQIVAIVGLLVLAFVLEPALLAVVPEVGKFGPTTGAPSGIIGISPVDEAATPARACSRLARARGDARLGGRSASP